VDDTKVAALPDFREIIKANNQGYSTVDKAVEMKVNFYSAYLKGRLR
jgi:hypothetical protein